MIYKIIIIRYLCIYIIMVINMLKIYNKEYRLMSIISIISIISIMNWPNNIIDVNIYILNIIIGYKINISYNYIGLYMSLVLDILIWICMVYERYYIINNNIYNIILYYIINNIFFSSNDLISISLIYEFQTIPLLLIINNNFHTINIYNKKGIGISNILLIVYSIISGLLLYNSCYSLYLINHMNNINQNVSILLYNPNHFLLSYIILNILISGSIKLSIFPFHIWLGKVHVEAPTIGSIVLAGISLKTGFYIHYLFLYLFVFIDTNILYFFIFLLFFGIILNNINIFYQIDTKRWIALYSIIHMNLYYVILFVILIHLNRLDIVLYNIYYIFIIIIIVYGMIGHSLISGGLFLIVGSIYDVTYNKIMFLLHNHFISPYIFFSLFILLLANSSFPFFVLFIFEVLSFLVLSHFNFFLALLFLALSCSNLLSSLFILYKYFYSPIIFYTSFDFLLLFLLLPILILVLLMGIQFLLPLHFISFYLQ